MTWAKAVFGTAVVLLCMATLSHAHRVNLFAWVENGMVRTESTLGGESKAKNSAITVLDEATGEVVVTGQTDMEGLFSFPVPGMGAKSTGRGAGLRIVLEAGPGHRAQWLLTAKEMEEAKPPGEGSQSGSRLATGPGLARVAVGLAVIFGLSAVAVVMLKNRKIRG